MKTFWYHYNKPASKKAGYPIITVHYGGVCHFVKNVVCNVPTGGKLRKRQPHFVVAGKCSKFNISNGICTME